MNLQLYSQIINKKHGLKMLNFQDNTFIYMETDWHVFAAEQLHPRVLLHLAEHEVDLGTLVHLRWNTLRQYSASSSF